MGDVVHDVEWLHPTTLEVVTAISEEAGVIRLVLFAFFPQVFIHLA